MNDTPADLERAKEVLNSFWNLNKKLVWLSKQNAESLGLTLHQMSILNILNYGAELSLNDLVKRLAAPKSTISVNVDSLVKDGLVERKTSVESRREIRLTITEEGKKRSKKSIENATSYKAMAEVVNQMPDKDIEQLLTLNKEVLSRLNSLEIDLQ